MTSIDAADVSRGHGVIRVQSSRKPLVSPVSVNSSIPPQGDDSSEWSTGERRDIDRRLQPTLPWIGMRGPLRRARGRRTSDQAGYVDRYSLREVALILTVFIMNVGDAFFTMLWLDRGGKEANPVMDFFLDIGPGAFLIQKCVMVGAWLVVLLVHKNFRFARIGLYVSLVAYAVLMLVHFGILAFGIEPPQPRDVAKSKTILERGSPQSGEGLQIQALVIEDTSQVLSRRVDPPTAE
jgi:hypothetical protein